MNLSGEAQPIAEAFVAARRDARALESYPGQQPTDLSAAYRIQDMALAIDGRAVIGWKVGRINPPADAALGANRLSGPIFADSVVHAADDDGPDMPVFTGGFAAAEAEILLHLAPGWNGEVPETDADTRALLDDVRIGIEIASSPYPGINADGPPVTVSDYGNNAGLVIGASLDQWRELDLCAILVRMIIDGTVAGEATAATMLDGPYGAVRFLLGNLKARGIDASKGLWISSGAITGVHPVLVGQHVTAQFDGHGIVTCRITAAQGQND
ncbi:2-keto-4-pentenoate hydratase [Sphingobium sufflavum]|uniref:2-keto-4-pentenoate hydratase n=1 Tax=Sphingobium sufflavum TaxID=1129547 RepID=UPI001F2268D2|nr:2-keto-4-pentenoate hydratase [Sphingobium sufflavum]MCE7796764.1 2-keto-4-pentenoate hydratase [Sphingobium sufflavum]